jgi:hypothetical protein
MGVNIRGWIEARDAKLDAPFNEVKWCGVVKVDFLLHRNTNAFGCLFGVGNPSHFVPVAVERGLPPDQSEEVEADAKEQEWCFGHSWVTWWELKQVDWDESVIDAFVRRYKKNEKGEWVSDGGFIPDTATDHTEGNTWDDGEYLNKVEHLSRADAVKETFDLVFGLMERMAKDFGDESVRLVVWFDG